MTNAALRGIDDGIITPLISDLEQKSQTNSSPSVLSSSSGSDHTASLFEGGNKIPLIALAGNPNSGKSALFNVLTGANARVANYPGVTVEYQEAVRTIDNNCKARFVDLPGCYSLTARSCEEEIAQRVLIGDLGPKPDLVLCVVDSTNLGRSLYLAEQILELELPCIVVLNMNDLATIRGIQIETKLLSSRLRCPVVATTARQGLGTAELLKAITAFDPIADTRGTDTLALSDLSALPDTDLQEVIGLSSKIGKSIGEALWLLTAKHQNLSENYINEEQRKTVRQYQRTLNRSSRISGHASNTFAKRVIEARYKSVDQHLEGLLDINAQHLDPNSERIDRIVLHPIFGGMLFLLTMFVLFQAVYVWAAPFMGLIESLMAFTATALNASLPPGILRSLLVNGVIAGIGNVLIFVPQIGFIFCGLAILEESGYLARAAFLLDTLMTRVGLHGKSFVPMMSGFACAVPGIMATRTIEAPRDRLITLLITPFISCSARLPIYVMVTAALFGTAQYGGFAIGGLVITAMYMLSIVAALGTAWILRFAVFTGTTAPLLIEFPPYRLPTVRAVSTQVYKRLRIFVIQTGGVILALSILLWAALSFPNQGLAPEQYAAQQALIEAADTSTQDKKIALERLAQKDAALRLEHSLGGSIGHFIEPVIEPLGFDWRIGIGLVASFAAREVLVSTLGQVYALGSDVGAESPVLHDALLADIDPFTGKPRFTPLVGLSLLVFFVLALQCLSTVAAVKRETNSWRWPLIQLFYMNGVAYGASFFIYQTGRALGY